MAQTVSQSWNDVWPDIRPIFIKYLCLLSLTLIAVNVIVFIYAPRFESKWYAWANIFLISAILIFSFFRAVRIVAGERRRKRDDEIWAREEAKEVARLAKIRESMTDAEWAMYEVQLENKELLIEIKNKKTAQNTSPQWIRGITYDIGGDN